jgi:hypothetical protein
MQHFLNFLPDPHGQGSFRPGEAPVGLAFDVVLGPRRDSLNLDITLAAGLPAFNSSAIIRI